MTTLHFPLTLEFQNMPLGVYREVQAHLQQLQGLQIELLPQTSPQFDYHQSQLGGIRIQQTPDQPFLGADRPFLQQILAYYHNLYPLRDCPDFVLDLIG